jgi:hypothetical protein
MEFNSLDELRRTWMRGNFQYPEEIHVANLKFKRRSSSKNEFEDIIINGAKPTLIYQTSEDNKASAKEAGIEQWLVFVWGTEDFLNIRPYEIRPVTPSRYVGEFGHLVNEQQDIVGDVVLLKIMMPSGIATAKGKVDTGAEISSIHADEFKIVGDSVKFRSKSVTGSDNTITAQVVQKQAVKNAEGVEYRPVIEMDIEMNGKPIRRVMFNLNDRSTMEYPVLIGQNVLEKSGFLVNPRMNEDVEDDGWISDEDDGEINWALLAEDLADTKPVLFENEDKTEEVKAIFELLKSSNVTFEDLVRHVRTDARQVLEDIEY